MKIGILANSLNSNPRGIGKYVYNILKYIDANDRQNEYIIYMTKEFDGEWKFSNNIRLKTIIVGKPSIFWITFRLKKVIERDEIDVFWGPDGILPIKSRKVKYVSTVHDLLPISMPKLYNWRDIIKGLIFVRCSCKRANKLISVSNYTSEEIVRICKVHRNKIIKIYNGSGDSKKSVVSNSIEKLTKAGIKNKYFLYVGAIRPNSNKNLETIVQAFKIFAEKNNDVYLVLAGKTEDKEHLCECVTSGGIRKRIIFTGYVSDELRDILYTNTVSVIFPTLGEGFGFPILEAMNSGVPIIVSSNTCLHEVGGDVAIYLKNEKDASELADKMEFVLNLSDKERQKIVQKGYEQASKFSWEKCAEETLKVLTENW